MNQLRCFAIFAACTFVAPACVAQQSHESDSFRNINQINIGVGVNKRYTRAVSSDVHAEVISKNVDLKAFSRLRITLPCTVEYVQGAGSSITLVGRQAALDNVVIEESAGSLVIRSSNSFVTDKGLQLKITGGALTQLELSGAIDASLQRIKTPRLALQFHGAVDIAAQGRVGQCRISLSGSSDAMLEDLRCETAQVTVQGASDLHLYASQEVSGAVSGAADLTVSGGPSVRDVVARGVADISYE